MIKTYYIFRHGLATHSKTGYGADILTAEVLPEALPTVERLAGYLKTVKSDFNVSSELIRCCQTSDIVGKTMNHIFERDARINEFHNETFEVMKQRVQDFLTELNTRPFETVMICSHGMIIAALTNFIIRGSFSRENQLDYPAPAGLFIIQDRVLIEKLTFDTP